MSVSRASAARERESISVMSGVGRREKSLVHIAIRASSTTKPGRIVGMYGRGVKGGNHWIDNAAWSKPSEALKQMETGEKHPEQSAELFRRAKSMTESH